MDDNCITNTEIDSRIEHAPEFSIKKTSELTGISIYTLRYYDKEGLFPFLYKNKANVRIFSQKDVEWIKLIECLRHGGMAIDKIREYIALCREGDSTLEDRYEIIKLQEQILEQQIEEVKKNLEHIQFKRKVYEKQIRQYKRLNKKTKAHAG